MGDPIVGGGRGAVSPPPMVQPEGALSSLLVLPGFADVLYFKRFFSTVTLGARACPRRAL